MGRYSVTPGQWAASCTFCPTGQSTEDNGQTSDNACEKCAKGFFESGDRKCELCPNGHMTVSNFRTLHSPKSSLLSRTITNSTNSPLFLPTPRRTKLDSPVAKAVHPVPTQKQIKLAFSTNVANVIKASSSLLLTAPGVEIVRLGFTKEHIVK